MCGTGLSASGAVVVTGATAGIGLAVCRALSAAGYAVIGVGYREESCARAFPDGGVTLFRADLTRQAEVRRAAHEIRAYLDRHFDGKLHALINNAGGVRGAYTTTEDGYETVFALNHLAGFLLAHELLPPLIAGRGRLITTSSASHRGARVRWADIMFQRRYRPLAAYKQSKLCNLLFAYGFQERFGALGVSACCVDPGLVRTEIGLKHAGSLVAGIWRLRMRGGTAPEVPARTYRFLCDNIPDSLYYHNGAPVAPGRNVDKESADRLWALSEKLCGLQEGSVCAY